jgi:hypothetical protein
MCVVFSVVSAFTVGGEVSAFTIAFTVGREVSAFTIAFTIGGEVSALTIGGESRVALALVLAAITPFFFLFFGGRPAFFFGWLTAKNRLIPCAPAYAFADAAPNGFLGGAIVDE